MNTKFSLKKGGDLGGGWGLSMKSTVTAMDLFKSFVNSEKNYGKASPRFAGYGFMV